jgi:hypothetical protein
VLHVDGFVIRTFVPRKAFFTLVGLLSMTGCHAVDKLFCNGAGCEWTKEEWTRVQSLSNPADPLGLPTLPDNPSNVYLSNPDLLELGRHFYFDPRFSGVATLIDSIGRPVPYARAAKGSPIGVACADCHNPIRAGGDFTSAPNTVSIGAGWYDVNGQQTVNAVYFSDGVFPGGHSMLYWNGRTDSLWAQAAQVNESSFSMNGDRANTFWVIVKDVHVDREQGADDARSGQFRQSDRGVRANVAGRQLGVRSVRARGPGLRRDLASGQTRRAPVRRQGVVHRLPQRESAVGRRLPQHRRPPDG